MMEDAPTSALGPGQAARTRGRRRRTPTTEEHLGARGPLSLVVVVADTQGRWSAELSGGTGPAQALREALAEAGAQATEYAPAAGSMVMVGIALVSAWRFVTDQASDSLSWNMMRALAAARRRCAGAGFMEHPILAVAQVCTRQGHVEIPDTGARSATWTVPQDVLTAVANTNVRDTTRSGASSSLARADGFESCPPVGKLLTQWRRQHGDFDERSVRVWALTPLMAHAVARGILRRDVSILVRRDCTGTRAFWEPPPDGTRKAFMAGERKFPQAPAGTEVTGEEQFKGHPYERIVGALRATMHQASISVTEAASRDFLRYLIPDTWEATVTARAEAGVRHPSRFSIARARVRLDVAAMLARRKWYACKGPTYRYIGFEASPQKPGIEVFATIERVVLRAAVDAFVDSGAKRPEVEVRMLPLTVLGQGKAGLADKVAAHVHQSWLEYGPGRAQLRAANLDVRQCMSDMGTEFAIADCGDVVDGYLDGQCNPAQGTGFLYPLALAVPGPQHILDNALKDCLPKLAWWLQWQAEAKIVCQWVHSRGNRDFLAQALRGVPSEENETMANSLRFGVPLFAHWRWGTVSDVTRGLLRVSAAVQAGVQRAGFQHVRWRDGPEAHKFLAAVRSQEFWDRAVTLRELASPIAEFSGWLKGCNCHGWALRKRQKVDCKWKSCRALTLSHRISKLVAELRTLRDMPREHVERSGVTPQESADIRSHLLGYILLKFAWVNEVPYLVWQAAACTN